jgi:hypothetical protein
VIWCKGGSIVRDLERCGNLEESGGLGKRLAQHEQQSQRQISFGPTVLDARATIGGGSAYTTHASCVSDRRSEYLDASYRLASPANGAARLRQARIM